MNTPQSPILTWKCPEKHIQRSDREEYIQHVVRKTCDHKKSPSQIKSDYPVIDTFIIQYINVYKKIKDINLRGRYIIQPIKLNDNVQMHDKARHHLRNL